MSQPTIFIGSSSEGLEVAKAIAEGLEKTANTKIWDENVFDFNRGFLEELISELDNYDFAVLVLTADDLTESRGTEKRSPRDNVLFECGLFMGRLGRDRTFVVCDATKDIRIPSDLAGVTLATYDGSRMETDPTSAVRGTCLRISKAIGRPEFQQLAGEWRSRYRYVYADDGPALEEDVIIRPARGKISIESKENPRGDNYEAYGRLMKERHFVGEWRSTRFAATACGAFLLTLHPRGDFMYGYYTSPGNDYRIIHGAWVMVRKKAVVLLQKEAAGAKQQTDDERKAAEGVMIKDLLDQAERTLRETSQFFLPAAAPSQNGASAPGVYAETAVNGSAARGAAKGVKMRPAQ